MAEKLTLASMCAGGVQERIDRALAKISDMSNFIFRVKDNDRYGVTCALFEADGGAWKNEAKANIKAYLEKELADVSNIFVIS